MLQDERLIELISGSLDDALSSEESAELQAALAGSQEARQLMEELRLDRQAVRALPGLSTPETLKQRTLLKVRASRTADLGHPWQRVLVLAACVAVVFGIFYAFRPIKTLANVLHMNPGQLAKRADAISEELHLAATGAESSHTMVSERMSGQYVPGTTRVRLRCDAGKVSGGKLAVRLHFDFDGDGKIDLRSPSRVVDVDQTDGYQELVCFFPHMNGMRDMTNGIVHLEVACLSGPPLKLKFDPEQARVELPFEELRAAT